MKVTSIAGLFETISAVIKSTLYLMTKLMHSQVLSNVIVTACIMLYKINEKRL